MFSRFQCGVISLALTSVTVTVASPQSGTVAKARTLHRKGQYRAAITTLRQTLKSHPDNGEAHYVLAWSLVLSGKRQEAVGHFQKAITANITGKDLEEARGALQRMGASVPATPPPTRLASAPPTDAGKAAKAAAALPDAPPGMPAVPSPGAPPGMPMTPPAGVPPGMQTPPPASASATEAKSGNTQSGDVSGKAKEAPPQDAPLAGASPDGTGGGESKRKSVPWALLVSIPAAIALVVSLVLQKKGKAKE